MRAGPGKRISTSRLAFVMSVATLAYLGLAVLGWGGLSAFFSHPALIVAAIILFALSGVAFFTRGNLSPGERKDRSDRCPGCLCADRSAQRIGSSSGRSTATRFAGSELRSSPPEVRCVSCRYSCSAGGSAGWSRSSRGMLSSPAGSIVSYGTQAISGCSSTLWNGRWLSGRGSACCSPHSLCRRSLPVYAPKNGAAAHAIRRRVCRVLRPHVATGSRRALID